MSTVVQAYRFALDPIPAQEAELRSHCGGQRYAFNWGLARVKANLDQRAAEKTYDLSGDQLTASLSWSAYSLRKDWNQAKAAVAPRPGSRGSRANGPGCRAGSPPERSGSPMVIGGM